VQDMVQRYMTASALCQNALSEKTFGTATVSDKLYKRLLL